MREDNNVVDKKWESKHNLRLKFEFDYCFFSVLIFISVSMLWISMIALNIESDRIALNRHMQW